MTPPDLIAALDAQIERYQIAREVLLELGAPKLLGPAAPAAAKPRPLPAEERPAGPEEPPPGKSVPRPAAADGPGASDDQPRRLRIARYLLDHGPRRVGEMVAAGLGSQPTINVALRNNPAWFRKTGPGHMDPWELTETGRASMATNGAEPR